MVIYEPVFYGAMTLIMGLITAIACMYLEIRYINKSNEQTTYQSMKQLDMCYEQNNYLREYNSHVRKVCSFGKSQ